MKKVLFSLIACIAFGYTAYPQTAQKSTSISSSLGLYVFPSKKQSEATQDTDETACYKWAKEQTGVDPMNPPKVEAAQVDQGPSGAAVKGAAGGAAAGAAVGAIAGNAGEGAAIGAVLGGLKARRARVEGEQKQQQENDQAAAEKQKELLGNFNKAFTACMEGKGYTVQ